MKKLIIKLSFVFSILATVFLVTAQSANSVYWDVPSAVTEVNSWFPQAVSNGDSSFVFFEEVNTSTHQIWISMVSRQKGSFDWTAPKRIHSEAIKYSGEVPDIFSVAMNKKGTIAVAVLAASNASRFYSVGVYSSKDMGKTFEYSQLPRQEKAVVGPRVFAASTGGFMLFASLGESYASSDATIAQRGYFTLLSARSSNGVKWSALSPFAPSVNLTNPFVPYLVPVNGGDLVVMQGKNTVSEKFQLYSTVSRDGLSSWTEPKLVTGENSFPFGTTADYTAFQNQRPALFTSGTQTYIAWERSDENSENSKIVVANIDSSGELSNVENVTSIGNARRPTFYRHGGNVHVLWFDNRNGTDGIFTAHKTSYRWSTQTLVSRKFNSRFAFPLFFQDQKEIGYVWQQSLSNGQQRIYVLERDHKVSAPKLTAVSYTEGKKSSSQKASAKVTLPEDPSGIAGFSWIFTKDLDENPEKSTSPSKGYYNSAKELTITDSTPVYDDGTFYFKVRALDNAGNWSNPATISYLRDITPPSAPKIDEIQTDKFGFAASNDLTFSWEPSEDDDDVAGYSWSLTPVAGLQKNLAVNRTHRIRMSDSQVENIVGDLITKNIPKIDSVKEPPAKIMTSKQSVKISNYENGLYVLSVSAIDGVGNRGQAKKTLVLLNKYRPSTKIHSVTSRKDEIGRLYVSITGESFLYDGTISEVILTGLDSGARFVFTQKSGEFKVLSDERLSEIKIDDIKAGRYSVSVRHTDRGLTKWNRNLTVNVSGTVKYEPTYEFEHEWRVIPHTDYKYLLELEYVPLWILMALSIFGVIAAVKGLSSTARESLIIKKEVRALFTGDLMPMEKKELQLALKKRGMGLKLKLMTFTTILVLAIVFMVSVPLGYTMIQTQERSLAKGLKDRIDIMLESMSSETRNYLPDAISGDGSDMALLRLQEIPTQTEKVSEFNYATIVGLPKDEKMTGIDFVWASNDADIASKIDTPMLEAGKSKYKLFSDDLNSKIDSLNKESKLQVNELAKKINLLNAEAETANDERLEEIEGFINKYNTEISVILNGIASNGGGSYPIYGTEHLDRSNRNYFFYKPVIYRQGADTETYVRGLAIMNVSTDELIDSVELAARRIMYISGAVAGLAIIIGIIGALIVSSIIVNPIKRLAVHVRKIGDVQDKEELEGYEIKIKSRDEIRTLGDTVNDMTRGLVKAAKDEKIAAKIREENIKTREAAAKAQADAAQARAHAAEILEQQLESQKMELDGKAVQQALIPLDAGDMEKKTTASYTDKEIDLFCYYEGSDSVSGDFFDYKKLDERWYAVIKCDVSGHGIPAALLVAVIATIFREYFNDWSYKKNGTRINELAAKLNEFIGDLGLRGKFATLLIGLFDSKNDEVYLCHAGDRIVHLYDSQKNEQLTIELDTKESGMPAAGQIDQFMVDMKGGYKVKKLKLKKNDILFLYTDGIEEAQSYFKDENFQNRKCGETKNLNKDGLHINHNPDEEYEEFGNDRIKAIVESVFNKKGYRLVRCHPQNPNENLYFDFSKLSGNVDDMIMALASVEKVFRMYKRPDAHGTVTKDDKGTVRIDGDGIKVDRKIDEFLKKTFNGYDFYCSEKSDIGDPNYIYYTGINEDKQADDLTIFAVKNL
ncbi:SpoIIE family protein phosphatase [Treponema zioleckii]|uniref:SpoIIE family protein phosphatase n=1 Tax=Treponema zioleckii TaxID=331680 RepID=UPI00168B8BAA|nr:SpoIIE family protein phosphatase [Treponema zioleckii]